MQHVHKVTKAYLVITHRCNGRCRYCYYRTGAIRKSAEELDTDTWLSVIDVLTDAGAQIAFTGGEPTERVDLPALVARAADKGGMPIIVSDIRQIRPTQARSLADAGLWRMSFSIHSGSDWELRSLARGLRLVRSCGIGNLRATFMFDRTNHARLSAVDQFLKRNGVRAAIAQPIWLPRNDTQWAMTLEAAPVEERRATLSRLYQFARNYDWVEYWESLISASEGGFPKCACTLGRERLVIDTDGGVLPCFFRSDLSVGTVATTPLGTLISRLQETCLSIESSCGGWHCMTVRHFGNVRPSAQ
jgi:MoaA/NifB/PqqE/SkfB family radical SAM enzyme